MATKKVEKKAVKKAVPKKAPTEAKAPVVEAPKEAVEDKPMKIEGHAILSIEKVGNLYKIQAANGCSYTLPEVEYKNL